MSAVAFSLPAQADATTRPFSVVVEADLARVEHVWRRLESQGASTPFQSYDWIAAYAASDPTLDLRFAIVHDAAGRAIMLLPLEVGRFCGARIATLIGGKHASYAVPVLSADWDRATDASPRDILVSVGRRLGVDALTFEHAPPTWAGRPNPLAAGGQASPSTAFALPLGPTPDASLERGMSGSARKKLRAKERHIDRVGTLSLVQPTTPEAIDEVLQDFLRQKDLRFRQLGIANPFADAAVQDFLVRGTRPVRGGAAPIILYALKAGDLTVAVLGGAIDAQRFSCMFLSFEADERVIRYSPGDVLVSRVIRAETAAGRAVFDLGVGDAFYKRLFCTEIEPLLHTYVPITSQGRIVGAALESWTAVKRIIKRNAALMRLVRAIRRSRARSAEASEAEAA